MNGVYIHIPFCLKKCLYCDFVSYVNCSDMYESYVNALDTEMSQYKGEKVNTVFIGGGTPTILKPNLLDRILGSVSEKFDIDAECEFTVESNPKTLDAEKLSVLKKNGVNRLSIGVQSFFDNELIAVGRIHTADDAEKTILLAQDHGFENINVDIMSSLPYQTEETLIASVKKAVSLGVKHISCYSLIIEEGTPIETLYDNGTYKYPDDSTDRKMYYSIKKMLAESGFNQYEISNFAKSGSECRHNLKYWQGKPYIGIGVAAHSFNGKKRWCNTEDLKQYLKGEFLAEEIILSDNNLIEEYMITGLRTSYGIDEVGFLNNFGIDVKSVYKNVFDKFIKSGHMEYNNGVYRLTDKGIDISNNILCEFIL